MTRKTTKYHDDSIQQMVQAVFSDILDSVIDEFETATGAKIGAVKIGPADDITDQRTMTIDIKSVNPDSLVALMHYKKLLCEHEPLRASDFCKDHHH